jgi:hypothetical protein
VLVTYPNTTESSVVYGASLLKLKIGVRQKSALRTIIERLNFGEKYSEAISGMISALATGYRSR